MTKTASDLMTPDPACCSPKTTIDQVAKMMIQNDCGGIPVIDVNDRPVGVITDRDIACRIVAEGMIRLDILPIRSMYVAAGRHATAR